jgi:RNA polymerase sigma-70 factor (ECF subfamily)
MLQNVHEAEDLTQETFLQIHRKLHLYRGEAALSTWIHRLTINQVLMYLRKVKKRRACETPIEEGDGFDDEWLDNHPSHTVSPDIKLELEKALAEMPKGYRQALVLHDYEGYEHEQISQITGHSVGTSKSQLHKARNKMQRLLSRRANPRVLEAA